ncbi:MAG: MBL fold metallo-hydrolase [Patescibacteria group bacterium]|nr:MBL fold metallo-hydrolase [Patescibacteria group bacterium]
MLAEPLSGKLNLSNDGKLEIVFIGVGSAFAARHFQTNFLIIKGNKHIAVDFGMTGPQAFLTTAGLKPTDIEVILPTHSHADHVGGMECLGLMNRYVGRKFMGKEKMKMIITSEYQRALWDGTLRGGMEFNEEEKDTERKLSFFDFFEMIQPKWKTQQPREIYEITLGDIRLELFRTKHIPDQAPDWEHSFISYGLYLVDEQVFISCDTRFDQDLIELYADKSKVMFHDVQFFPGAVHAPLEDLKTLPRDIKEKMFLVHYADDWENQDISGFGGWTMQGMKYTF